MPVSRRKAIQSIALAVPAIKTLGSMDSSGNPVTIPPIAAGPFKGTRESLKSYKIPDWFRDAKFGIWAHWGPQSGVEAGDWYARNMYLPGERAYKHHLENYGHPSKFGFKDLIPNWKAEKFDSGMP